MNASVLASFHINKRKVDDFNSSKKEFDSTYLKELIKKQEETIDVLKRKKTNVIVQHSAPIDFEHELFRLKNTNWNA